MKKYLYASIIGLVLCVITGTASYGQSAGGGSGLISAPAGLSSTGPGGDLELARIAGSTFSTVQHLQDVFHSAGWVSGGGITDDADGTITVAAGIGLIRATDSPVAEILYFDWSAESGANVTLADNDISYIYVEYNAGSPQVVARTTVSTDFNTDVLLAVLSRAGTVLHINETDRHEVGDHANNMIRRLKAVLPYGHESGAIIGAPATVKISLTAGVFWRGLTRFTTSAVDTNVGGTFTYYYNDGAWQSVATQTDIDELQYNDFGTGLAALSNNKYGVHWVYKEADDDDVAIIYGLGDYTLAQAEDAGTPTAVPQHLEIEGILVGKIIIGKGDAFFTQLESSFTSTFQGSVATDHGNLAGLTDDDHTQYVLADGTRALAGAWDMGSQNLTNVDIDSGTLDGITTLGIGDTTYTDRTITVATGGVLNVVLSGASGDDFTVDTDKLVVEGDTGNVGIGTVAPLDALHIVDATDAVCSVRRSSADTGALSGWQFSVSTGVSDNVYRAGLLAARRSDGNLDLHLCTTESDNVDASDARLTVLSTGDIGIGTVAPGNPLAVNRAADGIIVDFESADIVEGTISIADNTTSYNAFVGSHYTQLKEGQVKPPKGAVMVSTGEIIPCSVEKAYKIEVPILTAINLVAKVDAIEIVDIEVEDKDNILSEESTYTYDLETDTEIETVTYTYGTITVTEKKLVEGVNFDRKTRKFYTVKPFYEIDTETRKAYQILSNVSDRKGKEYFVYVDTTTVTGDKRVYGTWLGKMSDDAKGMSFGEDDKPVYLVAQVGLFKIRVTDTNGNISNGDYLESSTRAMEAQKQGTNAKLSSTIAKSMIDVDWSNEPLDPVLGYKWKLIPCTY